ncbi:MAG: YihY/virulence factor BrkB family protein [Acidobacteriota bacterium]
MPKAQEQFILSCMTTWLKRLQEAIIQEAQHASRVKGLLLLWSRVVYHVARKAWKDHFTQRSAALAFFTLLDLFPVLILFLFFVSHSVLLKDYLAGVQNVLLTQWVAHGARQVVDELFRSLSLNLDVLGSGLSGFLAFLVLFALSTSLLMLVEKSFNEIWHAVSKRRSMLSRLSVLWTGLTLLPLLMSFSFAITARFAKHWVMPPFLSHFLLPYLVTVGAFFILYLWIPSVSVRWKPALLASAFAALFWELAKLGIGVYVQDVFTKSPIGKLYGSLALVPIGMAWIYYSWIIVLLGAELTYVIQHLEELQTEARKQWLLRDGFIPLSREAAVAMVIEVFRGFLRGEGPLNFIQLASKHRLHVDQAQKWGEALVEEGVLVRTEDETVVPARPPDQVTLSEVGGLYSRRFGCSFEAEAIPTCRFTAAEDRKFEETYREITFAKLFEADSSLS